MNQVKKSWDTMDMYLAAALEASGVQFEEVVPIKSNARKSVFRFTYQDDIEDLMRKYWANELFVDALKYANAVRTMKSRIWQQNNIEN